MSEREKRMRKDLLILAKKGRKRSEEIETKEREGKVRQDKVCRYCRN